MSKTWKSLLHEHFQQNNLETPDYSTIRLDTEGMDHVPTWKAVYTIGDKTFEGINSSKKEAGSMAAQKAYEYLTQNKTIEKDNSIKQLERKQRVNDLEDINFSGYNTILLVDGENCNIEIDQINNTMLVLLFAAKNTTRNSIFVLQQNYNNCYVFLSPTVVKDAADHLLTLYVGKLSILLKNSNVKYYVLTKDHYGEILEKIITNCKFICDLNELPSITQ
jgi:hypothetical protein